MTDYEQIKQMRKEINSSNGLSKEMLKAIEDLANDCWYKPNDKTLYIITDTTSPRYMAFLVRLTKEQADAIRWFIDNVAINNEFDILPADDYEDEVPE